MANLILVRHGQSTWNKLGKWTGWTDVHLNEAGEKEAETMGGLLKDTVPDIAFTSDLIRAEETLTIIEHQLGFKHDIPVTHAKELNERNYGDLTGKNKWEVEKEYGEEVFHGIRRSWDYKIPNGETLKDVYNRVVPYFEEQILPHLKEGKNVIIVAHGNSLRSLIKQLENISDEEIADVEIATGEAFVYSINSEGKVVSKKVLGEHPNTV